MERNDIMQLEINDLVLEVTRRCNMHCEHCLRGDAQNMDMSTDLIDQIIDMCSYIGHVTFTGGEPTLNLPAIRYFFEKAKAKYGYCPSFYVVTNGQENQYELACLLLWAYTNQDPNGDLEECLVSLSVDDFHGYEATDPLHPVRCLSFYSNLKEHRPGEQNWVQKRGRAIEYDLGKPRPNTNRHWIVSEGNSDDSICIEECEVYISADGSVVADCDLPYDEIETDRICKLDMLPEHCLRMLQNVCA